MGHKISIPSFDNYVENTYIDSYDEEDEVESNEVIEEEGDEEYSEVTIENLQKMLDKAIEIEDYESAAELRDVINDMKNDKN
jgi:protein-arginine kinase activator protein McsA